MAPIDSYVECLTHRGCIRRCVLVGVDMALVEEAWHFRDRL